ncbi:hypothetical protein DDB_G0286975 [Dictyostelium discoideum AX4]|uniref:Uncharacterized protein n=1 Tax=Dictyostelium discoideum TaxID=44689 RepID=Q54L17_DICDI|nr:hypothetical protein DDB_G0286975 [Dictyostelium discoideum AX4]EAL63985.1 hypothetical protein DDB_G0286975 [Dictyostelium discoideum AX4]|eukprot:XP_637486.1 hypothetical protein DDB_G0286975 [Dictyostelium discoideum AX4]
MKDTQIFPITEEDKSFDAAYSVISDKRLRDYYDREIHDEMVTFELEYFKSLNQKNHTLLSIMGILAARFKIASFVINTTPSYSNSLGVLQSFNRNNNAFSLGKIILAQTFAPSLLRPLFKLKDELIYPSSTMGKLMDEILWCYTSFVAFSLECYIQTANKLSFLELIKKVVLCQDGVTGKLNFKNEAYAFISSVAMHTTGRLIKGIVNKLHNILIEYVESKSLENPKSTFWRNSTLIIKSIYAKTFLRTLAIVPCETVLCQLSFLFVQRYLGNSVNLLSTNPISIATNLVKTQGYRKLYKSFPFSYATFLTNELITSTVNYA